MATDQSKMNSAQTNLNPSYPPLQKSQKFERQSENMQSGQGSTADMNTDQAQKGMARDSEQSQKKGSHANQSVDLNNERKDSSQTNR